MSVNQVTNNSDPQVEDRLSKYLAQYCEYNYTYTSFINDDKYKSYFSENGALKDLKEALAEKLEALKNAIDNVYNEEIIDELMKALGALLAGTAAMSLAVRVEKYLALLGLKNDGAIIEEDYTALLAKLNTVEVLDKEVFDKLLAIAKQRKDNIEFLSENRERLGEDKCQNLEDALSVNIGVLAGCTTDELKAYSDNLSDLRLGLEDALVKAVSAANETKNATQIASLSMRVIQANNALRDVESQLKSDASIEDRANFDENLRRLRDEGIWANTTSKRREEILKEEALQKARNPEQKPRSESI